MLLLARGLATAAKSRVKAPSSAVLPIKKLPELSSLSTASSRLVFESSPYGSPTTSLFPHKRVQPQINHTSRSGSFVLRAVPLLPRSTFKRPRSTLLNNDGPPPTLDWTTGEGEQPLLDAEGLRMARTKHKDQHKPYTMQLTLLVSKKKVHKHAVVRERIKRRFREAVRLVVLRAAKVDSDTKEVKEGDEREMGPRRWLVPGFAYVASLNLDIYRMPFADLLVEVRKGLRQIKTKASEEKYLAAMEEVPIPPDDLSEEELARLPPSRSAEAFDSPTLDVAADESK